MQAIDWSALRHAYGNADDIPALLEAARQAPAPTDGKEQPWFALWSALCHQGDVYSASYAAVPVLVDIAAERATDHRVVGECLLLAGCIELDRAVPEGRGAPSMPPQLAAAYHASLQRGNEVAARTMTGEHDAELRRRLDIALAAFTGDFARARLLADGPPESELDAPE